MNKQHQIEEEIKRYENECKPLITNSHFYSWLRIFCMVAALVLAIYADQSKRSFGFVLAALFLVLFSFLVIKHNDIKKQLRHAEAKIIVKKRILSRFSDQWHTEAKSLQCPEDDCIAYDLDLLGPDSLYAYISFCATPFGKARLMSLIRGEAADRKSILRRQDAIRELLQHEDLLLAYESGSVLFEQDAHHIKTQDLEALIAYSEKRTSLFPRWFVWFSMLCAMLCISALILAFCGLIPYGYSAVLLLVNLIISIIINGSSHNELSLSKDTARILKDYDFLFQCVNDVKLKSPLLCELQKTMQDAERSMKRFNHILDIILLRNNVISYFVLSALLQFDVICVRLLEQWRSHYGIAMRSWLEAAGDWEALVSLSVIAQVKHSWCFPEIIDNEEPLYEIKEGYHPLIAENKAVANSIDLKSGSVIITGSNMSGKTTFLRTLGIAAMMAKAGAPVCAKQMRFTPMRVFTSMRVKDDVKSGISTFYAELLRIRQMMEAAKTKEPMIVLIDEIFKGTNSADRLLCAETAIAKLHLPHVITLVSTHDFELCNLQDDPMIQAMNTHFSEYYQNDEIHFDYLLRDGRCTSTNAKELMRLAGIV